MAINKTVRNAIADGAVTSDKIEDGAITSGKLGEGSISLSKTPLGNAAPTISSLNTSQIDPDSGATVTITGTGFVSIPDVRFLNTSTGVRIQASTIGFTSSTTITAAFPSGQTPGTYKVLVENPDGKGVISTSTITYSAAPVWSTAANLGSIEEGEAVNIQLLAYDDDSTAVSSYSLVSGSLPSGVTLSGDSSVGALTGTAPAVDADTNYTFTIRATDDESQTSDREFTLTITNWTVANSLRFNGADNPKLSRTAPNTAPTNADKFTFSCWIKRSSVDEGSGFERQQIFDSNDETVGPNVQFQMYLAQNNLRIQTYNSSNQMELVTNRKFRDVSSWYSIIFIYDSSQSTASDRAKLYINGVQETSFSTETYPPQNTDGEFGIQNKIQMIGNNDANTRDFDGYMTEVIGVDGQALAHTDFGEFDEDSGIWKPKNISGIDVGNLGFYLPFTNSASLGTDVSGVGNFTVNNLTSIDQTTDTPTNNYATLNFLNKGSGVTLSEGNLGYTAPSGSFASVLSTIGVQQGKWYVEYKWVSGSNSHVGIANGDINLNTYLGAVGISYFRNGLKYNNDTSSNYGDAYVTGDIIGIALDLDNGAIWFSKNGTWQNSATQTEVENGTTTNAAFTSLSGEFFFGVGMGNSSEVANMNFGNPPFTISSGNSDANGYGNFEYAVPSGYFALNTKNLAEYG